MQNPVDTLYVLNHNNFNIYIKKKKKSSDLLTFTSDTNVK